MNFTKLHKEVERLVKIMARLRGKEGCPWDRKQDYYSLQPYILEEAYEVVEALQQKDISLLKEELGDLLLQVVFEAQIGREQGDFDLIDVFSLINEKLIRRHPHVFGDKEVDSVSDVMTTWNDIKSDEHRERGDEFSSILDGFSRGQTALNQGVEVQERAAEVGFDWDNIEDVLKKIEEEVDEVKTAITEDDFDEIENEIGDLLFAVVNLTRFCDVNPEIALLSTILKFRTRFKYIEKKVAEEGNVLEQLSLEELDYFWDKAKKLEGDNKC